MPISFAAFMLADAAAAVLSAYILPPFIDEVLPDAESDSLARLQGYTFLNRFAFVVGGRDKRSAPTVTYLYYRHGSNTRNTRTLTEKKRKRQTSIRKLEYTIRVLVKLTRGFRKVTKT
jgi:hypothetical protein